QFNSFEDVEPFNLSAYLQDKIEFDSFIVNAGIRLDYFDARSKSPADPEDPNIFNPFKITNRFRDTDGDGVISEAEETPDNRLTVAEREAYWWNDTGSKLQVSPRLGVAYPITDQGVIHFSFGLFFQTPTLDNLFDGFGWKVPSLSGRYGPFGNPDLDPQRTTMYEIGFKQGFGDFVFDVTGYYRDVRDWVSTSTVITTALPGVSYVVFANKDYANTTGLTVTFKKLFSDNYGFDLSYTYQVVEGSNSDPADAFFAEQAQQEPTLALLPLNWDQTHKLAGSVYGSYGNLDASTRFRLASGFPYTPSFPTASFVGNDVQPEFAQNSRRIPSTSEVDLSLGYNITFAGLDAKIFFDAFNVLDTRNATNVYSDTGQPDLTLEEFRQGAVDPGFWIQPNFFAEPRRVQMGIEFKF
ncbi:MAG TPA: TonB-dependent receptor, partial [Rhodothermales bacterium]|nr:TonB-dependent receptor [Rhodothermales bacterium]